MATYVYETIPQAAGEQPERFEIQQSMKDDALTRHPQTGQPIRRVITGGVGFSVSGSAKSSSSGHSHSGGCCGGGCHH